MIREFKGQYSWLSNFAEVEIIFEGDTYRSVENAYMAAKNDNPEWRRFCMENTPQECKKASRKIELKADWDKLRLVFMYSFLKQKFSKPYYKEKLLNTRDENIIEGNLWGDKFWGVCLKEFDGENWLGRMIMHIRLQIQKGKL